MTSYREQPESAGLDVGISRSPERTVVTVAGQLDHATAPTMLMKIMPLFEPDAPQVVLRLEAVEFVDSSGIGALVWAKRRADYTENRLPARQSIGDADTTAGTERPRPTLLGHSHG